MQTAHDAIDRALAYIRTTPLCTLDEGRTIGRERERSQAVGMPVKVVQRLPVRIRLNPDELAAHPLRVGLSMDAKVDLSSNS